MGLKKKHKKDCNMPNNNLYWCFKCKECYCRHPYNEAKHTRKCPNGEEIHLEAHAKAFRG